MSESPGEPADLAHRLTIEAEIEHETLIRCGICRCLLIRDDRELHRRWHNRNDRRWDPEPGYGDGFGANTFGLELQSDGQWVARDSMGRYRFGNTPHGALLNLIEILTGRREY